MPAVLKNHPQARLVVVGDGDLLWPLRVYARYLLLEHAVRLVGHLEGQPLDELIQAPTWSSCPAGSRPWWPIQAAWAARRPVVATHTPGPPAAGARAGRRAGLPPREQLVWGVERVLYDAELRDVLAHSGADKLEERFGWNGVAAQLEELLRIKQPV